MQFSSVNILFIFVQIFVIFHHHLIFAQHNLTDQEVEDFYEDLHRAREVQNPRAMGKAEFTRKKLPGGDTFNDPAVQYQKLECGSFIDIAQEGYIFFKLDSKNEPCHLSFIGSKAQMCTTAFLCSGVINLETSPFPDDDCDREWLILSDGTGGIKKGCHSFAMGGYARIPRNPGASDIYVYYKGNPNASCVAFCMEDLQDVHRIGIRNRAFRLSKQKNYKGLKKAACMCGKQNIGGRIVGGEEAQKFEFPWMVAIVAKGENFKRRPFCGGSLINDRYILSAAHCFFPWNVRPYHIDVVLHMHVADKAKEDSPIYEENVPGWDLPPATDEEENSLRLEVEEIINHPLFYEPTYYQDIALLKLKEPLDLSQMKQRGIGPICLPSLGTPLYFQEGDTLTTSGWGRVDENIEVGARPLQKVDVLYHDLKVCKKYAAPSDTHICAGYMEGGKDACQGDSGGPLIYQFNPADGQYLLAGIVSAGEGCARPTKLGYYTNVEDLVQWILNNTPDAIWCYKYLD